MHGLPVFPRELVGTMKRTVAANVPTFPGNPDGRFDRFKRACSKDLQHFHQHFRGTHSHGPAKRSMAGIEPEVAQLWAAADIGKV